LPPPDPQAQPLDLAESSGAAPIAASLVDLAGIDWAVLTVWLSALLQGRGADIMRIKAVIATPAGPLLLQSVRGLVARPEVLPAGTPAGPLTVIGRNAEPAALARSLARFKALAA
jgi:hypothetical protein